MISYKCGVQMCAMYKLSGTFWYCTISAILVLSSIVQHHFRLCNGAIWALHFHVVFLATTSSTSRAPAEHQLHQTRHEWHPFGALAQLIQLIHIVSDRHITSPTNGTWVNRLATAWPRKVFAPHALGSRNDFWCGFMQLDRKSPRLV